MLLFAPGLAFTKSIEPIAGIGMLLNGPIGVPPAGKVNHSKLHASGESCAADSLSGTDCHCVQLACPRLCVILLVMLVVAESQSV